MKGRIHSFQSMGTLDGPGVRAVVFLQGCPLRCGYCHNPDTWDPGCGTETTVQALMERILRLRGYFGAEGGVTVSGGEALLQAEFVTELFTRCRAEGIHTCLDTSGAVHSAGERQLLAATDLCLADVKFTREEDYRRYTGAELADVLAFLGRAEAAGVPLWIRQVIVPGLNDDEENIRRLNGLLAPFGTIERVELLPFHKLCIEKYRAMGLPFPFEGYEAATQERIAPLQALVRLPRHG